jgi:splicing factor 3B subunit 3
MWLSATFDAVQSVTVAVFPLDGNEAAFSVAVVPFSARDNELHLVVGTAADTFLSPRSCASGYLRTYRITQEGRNIELLHKVGSPPLCPLVNVNDFAVTDRNR